MHLYFPSFEPSKAEVIDLISIGSVKMNQQADTSLDERLQIMNVLKETNYHLTQTADKLNMARSTLYRKIDKYQIQIHK